MEKCCRAGQATDDNMAYEHCTLDTKGYGYKHTLRICNTYCSSTATIVARTRLNVTLHQHCLSCYHVHSNYTELIFNLVSPSFTCSSTSPSSFYCDLRTVSALATTQNTAVAYSVPWKGLWFCIKSSSRDSVFSFTKQSNLAGYDAVYNGKELIGVIATQRDEDVQH